jgi:archaellum component FlaC|tara:strand:+ start:529 stop:705 length:177 start_codon:yes stop_codon:yes gene_type:complete
MLELKKKQVELMKVECAKAEMDMKIMESEENIQRLKDNMANQDTRIATLKEEINELNK